MQNEGVDFPPRAIRIENRDRKQGERDNSWHSYIDIDNISNIICRADE